MGQRVIGTGDRLVFVVGARRSGTNWLQRILGSHPGIHSLPGETHLFDGGIQPLLDRFTHGTPATPTTGTFYVEEPILLDALRELCDTVLSSHMPGTEGSRLLERTPEHVKCIELILALFPGARFLHIVRDGRQAVASLLHQEFGPNDVRAAAAEWRDAVVAGRSHGGEQVLEIRYERLQAQLRNEVRRILDFLDLDVDDDVLRRADQEAAVRGNRPHGSPGRLSHRQQRAFNHIAGDLMAELGYEPTTVTRPRPPRTQPVPAPGPPPHATAAERQYHVDRLLAALRTGSLNGDDIRALIPASVNIEMKDEAGDVVRLDTVDELLAAVRDDPVLTRPIVGATLHTSGTMIVVVNVHEGPATRVWRARFRQHGLVELHMERLPS
ncbi:MAG: sulfotransferase [Nitriliruptorales bacterium]|nr:sulfotransferase [Nitriliruptorales bacterium]